MACRRFGPVWQHALTSLKRYEEAKELHALAARLARRVGLVMNEFYNKRDLAKLLDREGECERACKTDGRVAAPGGGT